MLPGQKEIKEHKSENAAIETPALLASGKAIESVQGLRQSLRDIDLDQITDAVERINNLQDRLMTLQTTLRIFASLSSCQFKVRQARDEVMQDLNRTKMETLQKPARLRAGLETDKFIAIHDLVKNLSAGRDGTDPSGPEADVHPRSTSHGLANRAQPQADQPFRIVDEQRQDTDVATVANKTTATDREPSRLEGITARDDGRSRNAKSGRSAHDQPDTDSLESATISNFDFELTDEFIPDTARTPSVEQPHKNSSSPVSDNSLSATSIEGDITADFDKKLLDDLIKNYGEFAVSPSLPATVKPLNSSQKSNSQPAFRSTSQSNPASARSFLVQKNQGDLDRNLKKLLKDYGQVDIYSRQSPLKTKIRAVAAFVVLGAVLSGIYYFSVPKPGAALNPPANNSRSTDGSDVTDSAAPISKKDTLAVKDSGETAEQLPKAIEASGSLAVKGKQTQQKNIKKGGSRQ